MAFASQGYRATFTLIDNGRKIITRAYDLKAGTVDHPAAVTATVALLADLEAVTDLEILAYTVNEVFQEGTPVYPTALNAQAEMAALLNVGLESQPLKTATMAIPGPQDSIFQGAVGTAGYDDVDTADADIVAFVANFLETGGAFSVSDGEQVADSGSIKSGRRIHRKSRRG